MACILQQHPGRLAIGAMTTLARVENHPLVKERFRLLSEAASLVASPEYPEDIIKAIRERAANMAMGRRGARRRSINCAAGRCHAPPV